MIDPDNAFENLKELQDIISSNGNQCWLTAGTLLGYRRENDFIKHDRDIDVGVNFKDFNKNILKDLSSNDWKIFKFSGYPLTSLIIGIFKRNVRVDLTMFYERNSGQVYHSVHSYYFKDHQLDCIKRFDYVYSKFSLKKINFLNHEFYAPANDTLYLEEQYGPDWQIPNSSWDYTKDPRNIVDTGLVVDQDLQRTEIKKWMKD